MSHKSPRMLWLCRVVSHESAPAAVTWPQWPQVHPGYLAAASQHTCVSPHTEASSEYQFDVSWETIDLKVSIDNPYWLGPPYFKCQVSKVLQCWHHISHRQYIYINIHNIAFLVNCDQRFSTRISGYQEDRDLCAIFVYINDNIGDHHRFPSLQADTGRLMANWRLGLGTRNNVGQRAGHQSAGAGLLLPAWVSRKCGGGVRPSIRPIVSPPPPPPARSSNLWMEPAALLNHSFQ